MLFARATISFATSGLHSRVRFDRRFLPAVGFEAGIAATTEEKSAAYLVEEYLLKTQDGRVGLHALLQELPELKAFCKSSGLRPAALLSLFPESFALEWMPTDHQQLCVRRADGSMAADMDVDAMEALLSERLGGALWKYHLHRPSASVDPVPLTWIIRTMPSPIEAIAIATAPASDRLHLDYERLGFASRPCAWAAFRDAQFRRFVRDRERTFIWHDKVDGTGSVAAVGLSVAEATRRAEALALPDAEAPLVAAEATADGEGAQQPQKSLHARVAVAAAAGADILLVRGSSRAAALFAAELQSAAECAGAARLPSHLFTELAPGLWTRPRALNDRKMIGQRDAQRGDHGVDTDDEAARRLNELLPYLASIRCSASVIATAPSAASMLMLLADPSRHEALRRAVFGAEGKSGRGSGVGNDKKVATGILGRDKGCVRDARRQWSLRVEQSFPSADHRVLPFHGAAALGELSIALSTALGGELVFTQATADKVGMSSASDEMAALILEADGGDIGSSPNEEELVGHHGREATFSMTQHQAIPSDVVRLVLVQAKDATLLLREESAMRGASNDGMMMKADDASIARNDGMMVEADDASIARNDDMMMEADDASITRLPRWVEAWDKREFFFSSSLDPLVALAAVNLAFHYHYLIGCSRGGSRGSGDRMRVAHATDLRQEISSIRVFDPCVGSGTVLAAAASRGCARLLGADVNAGFVERAKSNLASAGVLELAEEASLIVHDATTAFPPEHVTAESCSRTLVVSNPPWGNNIGGEVDGAAIVQSVMRQFAGATFCWLANSRAVQKVRCIPGVQVLRHVPFGSVDLVVCVAREPDGITRREHTAAERPQA